MIHAVYKLHKFSLDGNNLSAIVTAGFGRTGSTWSSDQGVQRTFICVNVLSLQELQRVSQNENSTLRR